MRTLLTFLVAFAALAALYVGPIVLLPSVGAVADAYGRWWGGAALAAALAASAAVMWSLSRLADARTGHLGPLGAGGPPDRLFCQACGAASRPDEVVCADCGSTRFGVRLPPRVAHPPAGSARCGPSIAVLGERALPSTGLAISAGPSSFLEAGDKPASCSAIHRILASIWTPC